MMKKNSVLFCLILLIKMFGQTNQHIKYSANSNLLNDVVYFCGGEKFDLKVDATATTTGDYTVQPLSSFLMSSGSTVIPFSDKVGNDHFSKPLNIGFNFSFYGQNYSKVVVGSNGRLVFTNNPELDNLNDTAKYKDRTHSGNIIATDYQKIPSAEYNKVLTDPTQSLNLAQIFFGYTDLGYYNPSDYDKLTYSNVVYNGKKGLLISFDNVIESQTTYTGTIKSQVLLLEDNKYIINIIDRNKNIQNAIIGVQNETGTKAVWPLNSDPASVYNNGKWRTSSGNLAFEFTPNQNLTPKVDWLVDGVLTVSNNSSFPNYSPQDASGSGENLKVNISFFDDSGVQVGPTETSSVTFKKLQIPLISTPNYNSGCGNPAEIHVINPDPNLMYQWHSDSDPTFSQTGTSIQVGNGSYFVTVSNTAGNCTVKSASQVVNIASVLPPFVFDNQNIKICDNLGQNVQTFNLAAVTSYPVGADYTVQYFENGNPLPVTSSTVNSGQTKNFTITVSTNPGVSPSCSFTKSFSISYLSFPPNNQVFTSSKLCDGVSNYSTSDFKNTFFPTSGFDFKFSTDGVNFNLNSVNPGANNPVFVKITAPGFTCQSIVKLNFDFYPKVVANQPTTQLPPQCANASETFDLASLIPEINPDPNVTVTFHNSLADAQSGANAVAYNFRGGLGTITLYIRAVNKVTGCISPDHPSIQLLVYLKPKLLVNSVTKTNCAGNNFFDLTQNISSLVNADPQINTTLEYYSQNGTLLTGNQITNYDAASNGQNPYIKVVYNVTCSDVVTINLAYNPKPAAQISQILICDELNYSLQKFEDAVITSSSQFTFSDEFGNALPADFDLSSLPKTVKFLIKNNATGCISDVQTVTFVKGGNAALQTSETDDLLCDDDFDGKTAFNLDSKKSVFTTDPNAAFEYFKDQLLQQKIPANYTNETAFAQTVFAKITVPGFCAALAKINLKVNTPTKSETLLDKYFICFGETVTVDAGPENVAWKWSTGETSQMVNIDKPGNYSVLLTNSNGCSYTHNFVVSDENQPKIEVINQNNSSIEVIANGGVKPYRYYFNGIAQNSNILLNPTASYYEIQVESATGCFGPPKTVYFIKISNAFTPNSDGVNDIWKIENLDKMENVSVVIADRFGNQVFQSQDSSKVEWNGKSGGRPLPTSTYWYTVSWFDPVTQKSETRQGWILMKNRN